MLEIGPAYEDRLVRIELFGDEVEAIRYVDPTTGEILQSTDTVNIYPTKHFVTPKDRLIRDQRHPLGAAGSARCAQRRRQIAGSPAAGAAHQVRPGDAEPGGLLQRRGEHARHLVAGRALAGCLIDYFPDDWLLIVDESHVTCSQLQAMYNGDQARKKVLIEHGFRLPSAADNRPLKGAEFWEKARQTVFVSATRGTGRWR